jgi:hypothetical protein
MRTLFDTYRPTSPEALREAREPSAKVDRVIEDVDLTAWAQRKRKTRKNGKGVWFAADKVIANVRRVQAQAS